MFEEVGYANVNDALYVKLQVLEASQLVTDKYTCILLLNIEYLMVHDASNIA